LTESNRAIPKAPRSPRIAPEHCWRQAESALDERRPLRGHLSGFALDEWLARARRVAAELDALNAIGDRQSRSRVAAALVWG